MTASLYRVTQKMTDGRKIVTETTDQKYAHIVAFQAVSSALVRDVRIVTIVTD